MRNLYCQRIFLSLIIFYSFLLFLRFPSRFQRKYSFCRFFLYCFVLYSSAFYICSFEFFIVIYSLIFAVNYYSSFIIYSDRSCRYTRNFCISECIILRSYGFIGSRVTLFYIFVLFAAILLLQAYAVFFPFCTIVLYVQ